MGRIDNTTLHHLWWLHSAWLHTAVVAAASMQTAGAVLHTNRQTDRQTHYIRLYQVNRHQSSRKWTISGVIRNWLCKSNS